MGKIDFFGIFYSEETETANILVPSPAEYPECKSYNYKRGFLKLERFPDS